MEPVEEDVDAEKSSFLFWFGFTICPILIIVFWIRNPSMDFDSMGTIALLMWIHLFLVLITTAFFRKKQFSKGLQYSFIPSLIFAFSVIGLFDKPDNMSWFEYFT